MEVRDAGRFEQAPVKAVIRRRAREIPIGDPVGRRMPQQTPYLAGLRNVACVKQRIAGSFEQSRVHRVAHRGKSDRHGTGSVAMLVQKIRQVSAKHIGLARYGPPEDFVRVLAQSPA